MKEKFYSNRTFLNLEGFHSNASLSTYLSKSTYGDGFFGEYKLADCSRTVEMSIDLEDKEDYDNVMFKLDSIIRITTEFKDAIVKLRPDILAYAEKERLAKEKRDKEKRDKESAEKKLEEEEKIS